MVQEKKHLNLYAKYACSKSLKKMGEEKRSPSKVSNC